jgi:hypothetical protein
MNITAINGRRCPLPHDDLLNSLEKLGKTLRDGENERIWHEVEQMREAQKLFFRTHNPLDLAMAKSWEKRVDETLREHKAPAVPAQNELFEGGSES